MTRVLSELLGANEPAFQLSLQQLERSAGHPNHDIRLSSYITQTVQSKLSDLGLDKHDTTGTELYNVLGERLKSDEQRFIKALQTTAHDTMDPIERIAHTLEQMLAPRNCFAMKATAAKKMLRLNLPKKTMKALGYRSVDSMLKHESAASLYAAAWLIESEQWAKKLMSSYSKLKSTDFESRDISIEHLTSKRWQSLAESVVAVRKNSVLGFKELGSVVLLPLPTIRPALSTLTTAALALHAVNDIRTSSTFLQLHQVQSNFGSIIRQIVQGEPTIQTQLLDQPLSWSAVHRYFARLKGAIRSEVFEPVVQAEDLAWHSVEQLLTRIEPSLSFWQGTSHLALLDQGQTVSCNLTDLLVSHCNQLPYEARSGQYFHNALMSELSLVYMSRDRLEQALSEVLHNQPHNQLAAEPALA